MEKITLQHSLPEVFADRTAVVSEIWHTECTFEKGKSYLIEAASGTGKSSLCSFIYGYRRDYQGMILFDTTNIKSLSVREWTEVRRSHISLMFQELRLFPELSAYENIQIKNQLTGHLSRTQILSWFDRLDIPDKAGQLVGKLSFGQQQRVALIRALCQPFDFLFLDEPVSHLDPENGKKMAALVEEEIRKQGAGLLVTSIGKHLELSYDKVLKL